MMIDKVYRKCAAIAFSPIRAAWNIAHRFGKWLSRATIGELLLAKRIGSPAPRIFRHSRKPFLMTGIGLDGDRLVYYQNGIGEPMQFAIGSDIGIEAAYIFYQASQIDADFAETLFANCFPKLLEGKQ